MSSFYRLEHTRWGGSAQENGCPKHSRSATSLGACAASCLVPRRPRGTRLMMAELLHPSPHIRQIYTNPTDATCTQLEGDLNEIYELLDQVVADYGVLAKSPDWWLQVPSNNLRPIELIMRCEDALGIDDDPQYAAEFLARMVADKYS